MNKERIAKFSGVDPEVIKDIIPINLKSKKATKEIRKFVESILDYKHSIDRLLFLGQIRLHLNCYTNLHCVSRSLDSLVMHPDYPSDGIYFSSGEEKSFMRFSPYTSSQEDLVDILPFSDKTFTILLRRNKFDEIKTEIKCQPSTEIYGLSCISREDQVILRDRNFWEAIANLYNLKLKKTDPHYFNKNPVTPGYTSRDRISGAMLNVGRRYRVDEINIRFTNPVDKEQVNKTFKAENVTKIWSKGNNYTIHSWRPEDTKSYMGKLLEIARKGK